MLNITTESAKKMLKPGEQNYVLINLDFIQEIRDKSRHKAMVFIIDDSPEMSEIVGKTSKYQYAISFIESFVSHLEAEDKFAVIKESCDKTPIIPITSNKDLSKLYKTYPHDFPDLTFSLLNAKSILDKLSDKIYNKTIVILSESIISNEYIEIGEQFYKEGIRISIISLNECADLGILSMLTKGNYYSLDSKRHFARIINKELYKPSTLLARDIEITLSKIPCVNFGYNLNGYVQKKNNNGSITIKVGKSFGHNEILIPYKASPTQGTYKFEIKAKYRGEGTDNLVKTKIENSIEVKKSDCEFHRHENETVVYRAMFANQTSLYAKVDRLCEKGLYDDAIDVLNEYTYKLNKFKEFVSATIPMEILKSEAKRRIKDIKRQSRTNK